MSGVKIRDRHGRAYSMGGDLLKVGRALDNDIVLADRGVSRYHVALQLMGNGVMIYNTGSDSGFKINGAPIIDSAIARAGDILSVGPEDFLVEADSTSTDTKPNADFSFASVGSTGLNVNSRNQQLRKVLFAILVLMAVGLVLLPEEKPAEPNREAGAWNAKTNDKPTQGLPTESFSDLDVPRYGPQELTADDLYKRGLRELSANNLVRAILYFQQSLVEDPSLVRARNALRDSELALKNKIEKLVQESERNYSDSRLQLSRSLANQALDLISDQIPGFSSQVQQKQRSLASQGLPVPSREQVYLELACEQTADSKLCERAVEILKRSRLKLGEENVLK